MMMMMILHWAVSLHQLPCNLQFGHQRLQILIPDTQTVLHFVLHHPIRDLPVRHQMDVLVAWLLRGFQDYLAQLANAQRGCVLELLDLLIVLGENLADLIGMVLGQAQLLQFFVEKLSGHGIAHGIVQDEL